MQGFSNAIIRGFERYMPEPFAFGIIMTLVAMVLTWAVTPSSPDQVLVAWGDGLSSLLSFITQVSLTVLFAYALAHLGPIPAGLQRLATIPKSPPAAYAFCALFTGCVCLVAWPLGTIMGGLMARQVAISCKARGIPIHYPLLGGAAFAGFVVWHMGYSASAPLMVATPGNPMEDMIGGLIPVTDTILAPFNLLTIVATLSAVAFVASRLHPKEGVEEIDDQLTNSSQSPSVDSESTATPQYIAQRIESSRWLTTGFGLILVAYVAHWFYLNGVSLDLNIVNWTFLAACLLLARSAKEFSEVLMQGGRAVVPFLLQYPLYAGIMGIMLNTGFVAQLANFFATVGTAETLPLIAFLSGGAINLFIPSGGAQWAIQGPAFLEAAQQLGTAPELIVMGVAYGDQWSNIIHPFAVIPLLIMTGLKAHQVLSYSFILFLVAGVPLALGILLASF
jgi:short-chain fatty acids transporter